MTRGKYAAKAANRMAEIDSEIVDQLRAKLAAVTAERDEARRDIARLRDKLASEVDRAARGLAAQRIEEASRALTEERHARAADRKRLGEEAFAIFDKFDWWPELGIMADLASLFGLADRVGAVVRGPGGNRNARRASAGKLRLLQASIDAGDRRI